MGTLDRLIERQCGLRSPQDFARSMHMSSELASRLKVESVLKGHRGCVNRLNWNEEGTLLASGSDDRQVILWRYPDTQRVPVAIETQHQANIFGVRILPSTNDLAVVTGAMDYTVQLHRLDAAHVSKLSVRNGTSMMKRHPDLRVQQAEVNSTVYCCHRGRVKDVEVEPGNPHLFWSASEDGTLRQFDARCRKEAQDKQESSNVLVAAKQGKRLLELKNVAINKAHPCQLLVCASDQFVRVYDRRMASLGSLSSPSSSTSPLLRLSPPHMDLEDHPISYATYACFGNKGDKIVATYHGDHVYSFDISSSNTSSYLKAYTPLPSTCSTSSTTMGVNHREPYGMPSRSNHNQPHSQPPSSSGSSRVEYHKQLGNQFLLEQQYNKAVQQYNQAIRLEPHSSVLYANRASALLSRGWVADSSFALCDCEMAVALQADCMKAHFRRVQALKELRQIQAAESAYAALATSFAVDKRDLERLWEELQEAKEKEREEGRQCRRRVGRRRSLFFDNGDWRVPPPDEDEVEDGSGSGVDRDDVSGDMGPSSSTDDPDGNWADGEDHGLRHDDGAAAGPSKRMALEDNGGSERSCLEASTSAGSSAKASQGSLWSGTCGGRRLLHRYVGHCNMQTDIKEACFVGADDTLVAAGSDDGNVYIYIAESGECITFLAADDDVANCIQCHPHAPVIATSGIESVVRIWSPSGTKIERQVDTEVDKNQERMREGPTRLRGINPRTVQLLSENPELLYMLLRRNPGDEDEDDDDDVGSTREVSCRMA